MHQIPESYHSPAAFKNSAIFELTEAFKGRTLGSVLSSLKLRAVKKHQWDCIFQSYAPSKQFIKNVNKPEKQCRDRHTQKQEEECRQQSIGPRPPVHQGSGEDVIEWSAGPPAAVTPQVHTSTSLLSCTVAIGNRDGQQGS